MDSIKIYSFKKPVFKTKINPEAVDWTKQDVEIAREWKVSRERVRQIRAAGHYPRSPFHKKTKCYKLISQITNEEWRNNTNDELAAKYNLARVTIEKHRPIKKQNKDIIMARRYKDIDWTKNLNELQKELNHSFPVAACKLRSYLVKRFLNVKLKKGKDNVEIFRKLNNVLREIA